MVRDAVRWLGLGLIGGALMFVAADPAGMAGAATADPFTALRVTPSATRASVTPFDLTTLDGRSYRSQDLAGKVVLLNFWATWCGPCKEEMPSLARLQTRFDPAQVQILTVTADRHPQGIRQFFGQLGISLPVLFDEDQEVSRTFMVRGLPTTVLIAPDGRVSGRAVGPRAWDSDESVALVRHLLEERP
ncbi:MAG: TlpA disulfide reductase family protein [Nitrospira sp.]|nr:TlpA disulfide reductase family protein [Nitrospira sp.]